MASGRRLGSRRDPGPGTGGGAGKDLVVRDIALLGHHERSGGADPGAHAGPHRNGAVFEPTLLSAAARELAARIADASLTVDGLRDRYIEIAYARLGSLQETGRKLYVDWRTVRRVIGGAKRRA
jgi:hypothetical protein